MTKAAKSFKIVGAHFRPPAKALLACLPAGAPIWLLPEPTNPYDAHAVKLLVNAAAYPPGVWDELVTQAAGYGFDADQLCAGEVGANGDATTHGTMPEIGWWHIGYIPAQKPGKDGEPLAKADIVWNMDQLPAGGCSGRLTFDATGTPMVTVAPWPPEPAAEPTA